MRPVRPSLLLLSAAAVLAASGSAWAQSFGQWSWDASAGYTQSWQSLRQDGASASTYPTRSLTFSLGLNGFLLHPSVGAFRLDGDFTEAVSGSEPSVRNRFTGAGGTLSLFPIGPVSVELSARRRWTRVRGLDGPDAVYTGSAIPDIQDSWGARLRINRGPLRGLSLFGSGQETSFVDAGTGSERRQQQGLEHTFSSASHQHVLKVERQTWDLGIVDLTLKDLTGTLDERASFGPRLRGSLGVVAVERTSSQEAGFDSRTRSLRAQASLTRDIGRRDSLALVYSFGLSGFTGFPSSQSNAASLGYLWNPHASIQVLANVAYGVGTVGSSRTEQPSAGLGLTWSPLRGPVQASFRGAVSYGYLRLTEDATTRSSRNVGTSVGLTIAHGAEERLRKELDLSWARNQFREAGDLAAPSGSAGTIGSYGLGTQDVARGRLTLSRRWESFRLSGYGDYQWQRSGEVVGYFPVTSTTAQGNLEAGLARFSLAAFLTDARVTPRDAAGAPASEEHYRSLSGTFTWAPLAYARLGATYVADERMPLHGPTLRGRQSMATVHVIVGEWIVEARAYLNEVDFSGGATSSSRGLILGIRRRFQGWLPIVSAPVRRGVVR